MDLERCTRALQTAGFAPAESVLAAAAYAVEAVETRRAQLEAARDCLGLWGWLEVAQLQLQAEDCEAPNLAPKEPSLVALLTRDASWPRIRRIIDKPSSGWCRMAALRPPTPALAVGVGREVHMTLSTGEGARGHVVADHGDVVHV